MKYPLVLKWLLVPLLVMVGCSTLAERPARPADFIVTYHWVEASLPRPYHYEYTVRMGPGSHGVIDYQPDYAFPNTPIWTETFDLEDADLENLYSLMWAKGVFTRYWRPVDPKPNPGELGPLLVTAYEQQFTVPAYTVAGQADDAILDIYGAIQSLTPQPVWKKLETQRQQYMEDFVAGREATPIENTPTPLPALTNTSKEANEGVEADELEGVIFSAANAATTGLANLDETYWTPLQADVLALEKQLGLYLQETAPRDYPGPLRKLSEYKRQYVGILINQQRVILVNFFCDAHGIDWPREFVFISDGGSCYFEVKYKVQTGEFSDLSIHGES